MEKIFSKLKYHLKEIFSVEGRLPTLKFCRYYVIVYLLAFIPASICVVGDYFFQELAVWNEISIVLNEIANITPLIAIVPFLTLEIRRLHDLNCSGWWCVIGFISYLKLVFLLFLSFKDGDQNDNKYGAPPIED